MEDLTKLGHNEDFSGVGDASEVDALNKALNPGGAQYTGTPDSINGGSVFMTESLEPTLKVVSEIEKHVKLFNMIDKTRAYQLVEEYDLQSAHGGNGTAWLEESDTEPREEDAVYNREYQVVKYMGVKKRVHHIMTQIRSGHGDVVAKETKNGVSYLLKQLERQLWEANGFYSASGSFDGSVDLSANPSFNGLDKQLRRGFNDAQYKQSDFAGYGDDLSHVVDLDDNVLSPEAIEESARVAIEDFGAPSMLWLSPKAHSDFSRSYYPKERFNDGKGNIMPGTIVPSMWTSLGQIDLTNTRFMVPKQKARAAADNTSTPNAPATVGETDTNAAATDLDAGAYIYRVTSWNKHGESAVTASAAITAAAGDRVNIAIADPASGPTPLAYAVYRSEVGGAAATATFVGYVKRSGATTQFIDLNRHKPGSSQAYLMQLDAETMTLRQLTPMLKIDFATIGLYRHWAQVLYSTPIVFKPNYNVILENIKERGSNIA